MFSSFEWGSSIWASRVDGRRVADLVADHSLWSEATTLIKATIPIVRVVSLIYEGDKPLLGFIYKTIDQAKETIKEEVKRKRYHYILSDSKEMALKITDLPVDALRQILSSVAKLSDGATKVAKSMTVCKRFLEAGNSHM